MNLGTHLTIHLYYFLVQEELLEAGVSNEDKVQEVIEENFLPQVGNQQRIFENTLETIDVSTIPPLYLQTK